MDKIKGYQNSLEVLNQIEVYRHIICIHLITNNIKASISEETVLAYYCAFGCSPKTDAFILANKVISSKSILNNIKSKLKSDELLYKDKKSLKVCNSLDFDIVNNTSFVILKLKGLTTVEIV